MFLLPKEAAEWLPITCPLTRPPAESAGRSGLGQATAISVQTAAIWVQAVAILAQAVSFVDSSNMMCMRLWPLRYVQAWALQMGAWSDMLCMQAVPREERMEQAAGRGPVAAEVHALLVVTLWFVHVERLAVERRLRWRSFATWTLPEAALRQCHQLEGYVAVSAACPMEGLLRRTS